MASRPHEHPVIGPGHTFATVTDKISSLVLSTKTPVGWFVGFGIAFSLLMMLLATVTWLLAKGVGIFGVNVPVGWGFDIINFVWWIGIGHAGTLISAILLLLRQQWRTSINRFAEAMTLFAVACAGLFPILHMGRPWVGAYWLMPYPNTMGLWPNFRSPLIWDVFAVSTYATVSLLFWFVGLIPDLATLRDRAQSRSVKVIYGMLAMGWRGSARHWANYETAYLILAGLSTPLVVSVHTVVSFDFAVGVVPGWHATIFPPYFVAGAIYSGVGMVLTLIIPLRKALKLEHMITEYHFDNLAKLTLLTGSILFYAYAMEYFVGWYSGNTYEQTTFWRRAFGPAWWGGWTMIICNAFVSQLFWFRKIRTNLTALFVISVFINVGMWFERYVIITSSLSNDFLPYAWSQMNPTWADWGILAGSFGWFGMWFLLFARSFPVVAIQELKELIPMPRLRKGGH